VCAPEAAHALHVHSFGLRLDLKDVLVSAREVTSPSRHGREHSVPDTIQREPHRSLPGDMGEFTILLLDSDFE
jgi:hypothetical protein